MVIGSKPVVKSEHYRESWKRPALLQNIREFIHGKHIVVGGQMGCQPLKACHMKVFVLAVLEARV